MNDLRMTNTLMQWHRQINQVWQVSQTVHLVAQSAKTMAQRHTLPVTIACTKKPNIENMARRPFLSSLTCARKVQERSDTVQPLRTHVGGLLSEQQNERMRRREADGAHLQLSEGVGVVSKAQGVEVVTCTYMGTLYTLCGTGEGVQELTRCVGHLTHSEADTVQTGNRRCTATKRTARVEAVEA